MMKHINRRSHIALSLFVSTWLLAGWLWQPTLFQAAVYFHWVAVVLNLLLLFILLLFSNRWAETLNAAPKKRWSDYVCLTVNIGVFAASGQAWLLTLVAVTALLNAAVLAASRKPSEAKD